MSKHSLHASVFLAGLLLAACSPDSQDEGGGNSSLVPLKASSGDGTVLAGALAFVDLNNNGQLDAFEPAAVTDGQGETATDPASCQGLDLALNCLRLDGVEPPFVVRVSGGFERTSGAPFQGSLAQRFEDASELISLQGGVGAVNPKLLSIVGALQSGLDDPAKRAQLAANLQPGDSLRLSALLGSLLGKIGADLEEQDLGELEGELAQDTLEEVGKLLIGDPDGISPGDAKTTDDIATDQALLQSLLNKVFGSSTKALGGMETEIAEVAREVLAAVRTFALADNPDLGRLRTVQILVGKAARAGFIRTQIQADAAYFYAPGEGDSPLELLAALADGDFDLQQLVETALDGDGDSLAQNARIPNGAARLDGVAGQQLEIERTDDEASIGALIYFLASGELRLCIRYEDFTEDNGLETEGTLVRGAWAHLDAYTLGLSLNLLGASDSATVRSVGVDQYRFDYDEEFALFSGFDPEPISGGLPNSSADCAQRL